MTPSQRLARAKRLVTVQEQMRRVAERDLAATRRDIASTEADRAALLQTLAGERMAGLFLDAAAGRLRRIAETATALGARATAQERTVLARGLSEKQAERWADGLARSHRAEEDRRDALEQLDLLIARGGGGLDDAPTPASRKPGALSGS
ncbi:hypothetical protein ASG40_03120 [Methylobacterium sp. Leaf399]|uniref:hypothetical protein n=1 Tax=Methylobacterium sp. Leaf399 TaxID=1736364 RepID=UPI0006F42E57|nr:hypothetical protein [Methylobacterium sp. Leaf399]KQT19820.1 hypothetical protein ASG40_03120 [Methylobacterium sp. Leaf399]